MTDLDPPPKKRTKARAPRDWCTPPSAFGSPSGQSRTWNPPLGDDDTPENWAQFRAAVIQHAIAITVRRAKNAHEPHPLTQEDLARLDKRFGTQGKNKWNARLNGRTAMSLPDISVLMTLLPDALPTEEEIRPLVEAAENRTPPHQNWRGLRGSGGEVDNRQ